MNPLLSGGFLAAALALGQTSEPPTVAPGGGEKTLSPSNVPPPPTLPTAQAPATQTPQRGPIVSFFMREDRPVLSKITGWFRREPAETPAPPAPPTKGLLQREPLAAPPAPVPPPPPSNDFPRRLPNSSSKATTPTDDVAKETPVPAKPADASKDLVQTTAKQASPPDVAKSPIRTQFVRKMGRDEKFDWITGQLELEHGVYVIYYATPETVDKYHGRIVLQTQQIDMKELHQGDLVSVRGQLVQRSAGQGMGPVYRLTSAILVERPKL